MARKSRTLNNSLNSIDNVEAQYQKHAYEVGVYRRLSVEADGDDPELFSLGNQMKIIDDYVLKHPFFHIKKVYTDNGISGMTFKRDGFQEMMNDLYAGVINCVIVKDISRLGRHYIMTSELVEKTLPALNVRLICINDNYDSIDPAADADILLMQFKMVMNDNYCKDFSKKIRSSINTKMNAGEFLPSSGSIPYGYIRNPEKNTFDIDEETAPVVKTIFELRSQGLGFNTIASELNDRGLPSPGRIRFDRGLTKSPKFENAVWLRGAIRKIVSDPVYTGCRIHGKVKRDRLGENKTRRNQNEWQIIENAHEPIIDKELFDKVQEVNKKANENRAKQNKRPDVEDDKRSLFLDKVFCGDCNSKMTARKGSGRMTGKYCYSSFVYFDCNNYHRTGRKQCSCHYIRQETLFDALENFINNQVKIAMDYEKFMEEVKNMPKVLSYNNELKKTIVSIRTKIISLQSKKEQLIEDKLSGLIEQREFEFMKNRIELQLSQLQNEYNKAEASQNELEALGATTKTWLKHLKEYNEIGIIDRKLIEALVDKILVYDKNHIEIKLLYSDPFKMVNDYVEKVKEVMKDAC